jgi:hypothetical protein
MGAVIRHGGWSSAGMFDDCPCHSHELWRAEGALAFAGGAALRWLLGILTGLTIAILIGDKDMWTLSQRERLATERELVRKYFPRASFHNLSQDTYIICPVPGAAGWRTSARLPLV